MPRVEFRRHLSTIDQKTHTAGIRCKVNNQCANKRDFSVTIHTDQREPTIRRGLCQERLSAFRPSCRAGHWRPSAKASRS